MAGRLTLAPRTWTLRSGCRPRTGIAACVPRSGRRRWRHAFLPPVTKDVRLDLVETRTFGSRVTYERLLTDALCASYCSCNHDEAWAPRGLRAARSGVLLALIDNRLPKLSPPSVALGRCESQKAACLSAGTEPGFAM